MDVNNTVYPNIGVNDPRNIFLNLYGVNEISDEYVAYVDISGGVDRYTFDINRIFLVKQLIDNSFDYTVNYYGDEAKLKIADIHRDKNGSGYYLCCTAWLIKYHIKNAKQGYVITAEAKSPAISNKIPEITSEVRIYFDLFMTKLYIRGKMWGWDNNANYTWWTYAGSSLWRSDGIGVQRSGSGYIPSDPNKYFNNIKFHIQKW